MIYFLNRGLILEQEIAKVIRFYFERLGVSEYYKNFKVKITNEHPFGQLYLSKTPAKETASRLPVVVIATESERKPAALATLGIGDSNTLIVTPEDIEKGKNGEPSLYEKKYSMMTPKIMKELREAINSRKIKRLYGVKNFSRRQDVISIDIWAENPQVKNELYELLRLFVCNFLREYLEALYREIFPEELEDGDGAPLEIFDETIIGQRSNNSNLEFGIELFGAYIAFEVNYVIEQSLIDTEIEEDNENLLLEVINHVKGYEGFTREWIIGPDDNPGCGEPEGDG